MRSAIGEHCLQLRAVGTARADLPAIAKMRKSMPAWVPADTPGHFLKHADEQTVLAVAAVDSAITACGTPASTFSQWSVIAAPRFIGRIAGCGTLDRFSRGGGPAISPHTIPQHSLHSISGALSILLGSRQPNFGVGGTANSLAEGLLAALTIPSAASSAILLVITAWDPEPVVDRAGKCLNQPICHSVALALEAAAELSICGSLRLVSQTTRLGALNAGTIDHPTIPSLIAALEVVEAHGRAARFHWQLPWGAELVLEAHTNTSRLSVAA